MDGERWYTSTEQLQETSFKRLCRSVKLCEGCLAQNDSTMEGLVSSRVGVGGGSLPSPVFGFIQDLVWCVSAMEGLVYSRERGADLYRPLRSV